MDFISFQYCVDCLIQRVSRKWIPQYSGSLVLCDSSVRTAQVCKCTVQVCTAHCATVLCVSMCAFCKCTLCTVHCGELCTVQCAIVCARSCWSQLETRILSVGFYQRDANLVHYTNHNRKYRHTKLLQILIQILIQITIGNTDMHNMEIPQIWIETNTIQINTNTILGNVMIQP